MESSSTLQDYIVKAREKGLSDADIKSNLVAAGWDSEAVAGALGSKEDLLVPPPPLSASMTAPVPVDSSGLNLGTMWDSFEHALLFISLYTFASSLALILHYMVDKYLPGATNSFGMYMSANNTILMAYMSAFVVSFPLFAFLFLHIAKRTHDKPEIRHLKERKNLIYLTLVGTFLIMLVNVIAIVFGFFNGNVSPNFLIHFAITVAVSAAVFFYYLGEVKEDRKYV